MNGNKTRKKKGGAKILSPEETLLAETGKEQLHLILMVMCVFLHKYYVVEGGKKQLYPEEIAVIVEILTKLRNQNESKLKRIFGVESSDSFIKEDPERLKKMDEMFRTVNAYENIAKFLKSTCPGDCVITVEINPTKKPNLEGELYKQVSFKFRLVLFLSDMISLLKNAQQEQQDQLILQNTDDSELAHSSNVVRGKVIETKLKMYKEFQALFGIVRETGYGISTEVKSLIKKIKNKWPKTTKTCTRSGGSVNYRKSLRKIVNHSTSRIGALFSNPDPELRDKYGFLLYFKVFTQLYEDNTMLNIKFDPKKEGRSLVSMYFGKTLYDKSQSLHRLYVKNTLGSVILIGSVMASQILSRLAASSPIYSAIWIASKIASVESTLAPIALAPFVNNPLMPIFQKEDIKLYNDILIFQSGRTKNVKKIAEISENYVRVVAILLAQPMSIKFVNQTVDMTFTEDANSIK